MEGARKNGEIFTVGAEANDRAHSMYNVYTSYKINDNMPRYIVGIGTDTFSRLVGLYIFIVHVRRTLLLCIVGVCVFSFSHVCMSASHFDWIHDHKSHRRKRHEVQRKFNKNRFTNQQVTIQQ